MKDIVIIYCIFSAIVELSFALNYIMSNKKYLPKILIGAILAVILAPILFPFGLGKIIYHYIIKINQYYGKY